MRNFLIVAGQVAVLFALMGVGAVCRRTKLVDEAANRGFVNLLILIVTPCIIVHSFQRPFEPSMLTGLVWAFAIAAAVHAVLILLALAVFRGGGDGDRLRPVLRLATVFSNAGFMGIPLEQAVLGSEGVFFGIAYVAVFNLFMWSWGLAVMRHDGIRGSWRALRPALVNPGTVGLAVALPLFFGSVTLPDALGRPIAFLADLNTPLAMLVIGFSLAGGGFVKAFARPSVHLAAVLRLVVSPLLLIAALYPFRDCLDRNMMLALVTAASAPVAAMVTMFASKFDRDVDAAAGLVSGTTLVSILTMPPVIAFAMSVL